MKSFKLFIVLFQVLIILLPLSASAAIVSCGGIGQPDCTLGDLVSFANELFEKLVKVYSPIIAVVFLMYAGFKMVISRGEPGEIARGKNIIKNTLIGLALVWGAYFIVDFIVYKIFNAKIQ